MTEALAVVLLLVVLVCVVVRPRGWPEAVVAVPAAGLLIATGAISPQHAWDEVRGLAPIVVFLGAVLVVSRLCADDGLFQACGAWMARAARGDSRRLLSGVFVVASLVTAVLSLDATVVLLTPVVFATAARLAVLAKPHVYACTHLSNSASLLLPVSNLTNLLAFSASGLSFFGFAALMAGPWLVAIAVEYAALRWFFSHELDVHDERPAEPPPVRMPVFALATVGLMLAGFVVTSAFGASPVWAAVAGALVLGVRGLVRRTLSVGGLVRATGAPFLLFVLALGVVVRAVVDGGLADGVARLIPSGDSPLALLGLAAVAAVLANVVNNLPAVLVLLPLVSAAGPGAVLAVLIGVNLGPNLTYAGSLATLLWRRVVHEHQSSVRLREYTRLGLLSVPLSIVAATLALWLGLHVGGL